MKSMQNYGSISSTSHNVIFTGDESVEFNTACESVVTNIYTINSSFKVLDTALKTIGTKRDNHGLRNKILVTQQNINDIVAVSRKEIGKLKYLIERGNKKQQLQMEKLEEDYKEAIGRCSVVQKEIAIKQKAHLLLSVSIEDETTIYDEMTPEEEQKLLARELSFKKEKIVERQAKIRQIESDVCTVNEIMKELAVLLHDQGEVIDTIENKLDYAVGKVEEGTKQVKKATEYLKKRNRKRYWFLCCL